MPTCAQSEREEYFPLLPSVTAKPENEFIDDRDGQTIISYIYGIGSGESHELRVDHFVHHHWSLLYSARYEGPANYGFARSRERQYTAPAGLTLGVALMAGIGACGGYNDGNLLLLAALIPDGVAYHHYINDKLDFSPYIIATGISFIQKDSGTSFIYSPSAGCRLMYSPLPNFLITGEYRVQYSLNSLLRNNIGIGCSVQF